jgi:hypothetical protein
MHTHTHKRVITSLTDHWLTHEDYLMEMYIQVLSQPLGNTSNDICPPMEYVRPESGN